MYIYGRKFAFVTDHKMLTTIVNPKTQLPALAAAHLQCWATLLSEIQYEITLFDLPSNMPMLIVYHGYH